MELQGQETAQNSQPHSASNGANDRSAQPSAGHEVLPDGTRYADIPSLRTVLARANNRRANAPPPPPSCSLAILIKHFGMHKEKAEKAEEQLEDTREWKTSSHRASQFQQNEILNIEAELKMHKTAMSNLRRQILDLAGPDTGGVADFLLELAVEEGYERHGKGTPRKKTGVEVDEDE